MRSLDVKEITKAVAHLSIETNRYLSPDMEQAFQKAKKQEPWPLARDTLDKIEENIQAAQDMGLAICQDTGMACVFLEIGQDVHLTGGSLQDAVNEGVRQGYTQGYLRKSVVADPIRRGNTGDNTPAVLYTDIVPGNRVKVTVAPKGFGSENMSRIAMLKPAQGQQGVEDFIFETAKLAGPNPCPPMVLGVGIGGTFERCALLAKKALLRSVDSSNSDPFYGKMEQRLLERINELGTGPAGYGGKTTALAVLIETFPTHIAGLPVAVNVSCHVTRHGSVEL
ncbi:MAG: fumarate hydratase [Oscillospiraceae bacterium]|nr:fumarate hydratase [Oscillospiraceae bacterium]